MLTIVNEANQIARSFRLTIGLIEGYGSGTLHTAEDVGEVVASWLASQREAEKPYLPGSVSTGTLYYYGRDSKQLIAEPTAFYEGDVSPEYNAALPDVSAIAALQELAEILAVRLNQTRIYLRYNGVLQILARA